jgi:hypothetical protein
MRWRKLWGFALVLALAMVAGASTAPAQNAGGNFFQQLFGLPVKPPEPVRPPAPAPHRVKRSDYVPSVTTRAPGAPGGAPVQATFHVEVIGDSLASLVVDGLTEAFASKPEIGIVNRARDASGLVRNDYYDWKKFATENAVAPDKPDFVVVMLGINDGQALREGADSYDTLSDKWVDAYAARVEAVVAPYVAAHIPVAWVGLPPMRADRVNTQAAKFNEIYRQYAEKAGAKFIDVFDAFADQNGQYDAFGPNVDGQNVKLRASDGIHFTKAGSRKLAHFLEAEIKRVFEKRNPSSEVAALPPDIEQATDDINAQIRREMGGPPPLPEVAAPGAPVGPPPRPLVGPILQLTARPMAPGGVLASRAAGPLSEPPEVTRVFRRGEPFDPVSGRADDFAWPKL